MKTNISVGEGAVAIKRNFIKLFQRNQVISPQLYEPTPLDNGVKLRTENHCSNKF